jgi:aspartyl-tRNA(Asn)/glutamyl-tRNA(Gln) amidotransferase subunit C
VTEPNRFSDPELVRHVAKLARLALSPEEEALLGRQLADILRYVDQLAEVDTTGVEPTAFAGPGGVFREPGLRIELTPQERLANAPDPSAGAFRVPKVI